MNKAVKSAILGLATSLILPNAVAWDYIDPPTKDVTREINGQTYTSKEMVSDKLAKDQCPTIGSDRDGWRCSKRDVVGSNLEMTFGGDGWGPFIGYDANSYKMEGSSSNAGAYRLANDYFYALAQDGKAKNLPESEWAYCSQYAKKISDGKETNEDDLSKCVQYDQSKTIIGDNIGGYTPRSGYATSYSNKPQYSGHVADAILLNNLGQCGCVVDFTGITQDQTEKNKITQALKNNYDSTKNQCTVKNCLYVKDSFGAKDPGHEPLLRSLAMACVNFWNRAVNSAYGSEVCNPRGQGGEACTICGQKCENVSFVGPHTVSFKGSDGKMNVYDFDGQNCTKTNAKIDIVAQ